MTLCIYIVDNYIEVHITSIVTYCSLEVVLEKQRVGEWTKLTAEEEECMSEGSSELPLRGPVADQLSEEELTELKRKVAEATKSEVTILSQYT